jgi:hypothetical protein
MTCLTWVQIIENIDISPFEPFLLIILGVVFETSELNIFCISI